MQVKDWVIKTVIFHLQMTVVHLTRIFQGQALLIVPSAACTPNCGILMPNAGKSIQNCEVVHDGHLLVHGEEGVQDSFSLEHLH